MSCLLTKTQPRFHICTYHRKKDRFISAALQSDGVWEPFITPLFQKALNQFPDSFVIDVGANIGYYSLLAGRMGHSVIAVEPQAENLLRLQKGVVLNQLQASIYLVQNALYDSRINVTLTENEDNQGGIWLQSATQTNKPSWEGVLKTTKTNKSSQQILYQTTTIDHLLNVADFQEAIIKIDIGKNPSNLCIYC